MPMTWEEHNQRYLTQALGGVRAALQRYIAHTRGESPADAPPPDPPAAITPPAAIETIGAVFGLSPFERAVLLLCSGVELDGGFAALCAEAHGDPQRAYPNFSLALAALPDAHWSALAPSSPLRRWRLVEVGAANALTHSPLRISERILHYLAGVQHLDERLLGLVRPVALHGELAPSHQALAAQAGSAWTQAHGAGPLPVIQLCGSERAGKRAVAAAACARIGLALHAIQAEALPTIPAELEALLRLWEREAALSGSALLLECDELDHGDAQRARAVAHLVENMSGALIVSSRERRPTLDRQSISLDVAKLPAAEQRTLWRAALGPAAERLNGQIDALVAQFDLGAHAIRSAGSEAMGRTAQTPAELGDALWEACRAQARPRLDDLAQRIVTAATWADLVLPDEQMDLLRAIVAHVRRRATVYEEWGFAAKGMRGQGISALFAGASGTGKTLAAETLANELRLDLYRIDLSAVVSKYIGETEKNLRRIFDAAEEGGAALLFDEADALFGKRSEVKDSHDRFANIEVSYLLQRMEAYRGLALLTTNLKSALDPAFLRRIRFVVQFPFPDAAQRAAIWRQIFPLATPTASLDAERLARLNIAGGNIRNIALGAAFLAADEGAPASMAHLLRAARAEYAKLEKALTEAEIEGWKL